MTESHQIQQSPFVADGTAVNDEIITATSLTELEARLHVQYAAMPKWRYHAAGRALARLREHGFDPDCVFEAEELCRAHHHIVKKLSPIPRDECSSLEILLGLPALAHDLAGRIRGGTATLSDALLAMESRLDFKDPARIAGAVRNFANIVERRDGMPLSQIPARLKQVENRLAAITHADFGVVPGTFASMKSRIRKAVLLVDMSAGRRLPDTQLLPAWQALITEVMAEANNQQQKRGGIRGDRAKLGRLISFCHERRIDPAQVTDETINAMKNALVSDCHDDAFVLAQDTVYAWERLQKQLPVFPQQALSRLYRVRDRRAGRGAFESLPLAFQAAWLDFEIRFGAHGDAPAGSLASRVVKPGQEDDGDRHSDTDHPDEDPFALDEEEDDSWADGADLPDLDDGAGQIARLSPGYLRNIKSAAIHAGVLLQDAGRPPKTLLDVLKVQVVERLLREKLRTQLAADRSMPTKNNTLRNVLTCMISVARALGLPATQIEALMVLRDRVDPYFIKKMKKQDGTWRRVYSDHRMGPRHKERLAAMADDNASINWFEIIPTLHGRLKRIIGKGKIPTPSQANDGVVLVLHAVTRCCPARRASLANITVFGPHAWLRMPVQKGGRARIVIPREFVKNRQEITIDLTPMAIEMLEFYLKHVRPVIAARVGASPENPYLFPAHGMQHRAPESLNQQFVDRNWKIGGFALNLHCQRHLAGKIILDRDPKARETVRQLLGHKNIKTTERYYTEINEIFAQREYHAHLEQHYAELVVRRGHMRTRRRPS